MDRGKLTRTSLCVGLLFILMGISPGVWAEEVPFTLEDRDRLIRLEATLKEFKESVAKQFEQADKRNSELRQDMNKRFEQVDKRFDQLMHFLYILSGIFTALVVAVIGFAYWDRRTIIRRVIK